MKSGFAVLVVLVPMLALLFLVGCLPSGVRILHLSADPGLTIRDLEKEGVVILPALASSPLMDARELISARKVLDERVAESRPTIPRTKRALVDSGLRAHPTLAPMLQRFARTLAISREDLSELGNVTGAHFVVFVVFDEYSFGFDGRALPLYSPTATDGAAGVAAHFGLVGLGISFAITAASSSAPQQPSSMIVTRKASARLAGTLSIFDVANGKAVWVGAAMVNQKVNESTETPTGGAEHDVPAVSPPTPAELAPRFFEALVKRWPS